LGFSFPAVPAASASSIASAVIAASLCCGLNPRVFTESNAMIIWRGPSGTIGVVRFIRNLLNNWFASRGRFSRTLGGQKSGEIDQRVKRRAGLANLHACTGNWIQHPRWNDDDIAGCCLDMRHSAAITLVNALASDLLPKQRMMRIIDNYKRPDMGRMTA